jgi:hypothetical protein
MFYFTVYHSQIDEASERITQTLKIALRYYIQEFQDLTLWTTALWKFQSIFNNTRFAIIDKISNELLYKVTSNMFLNISASNKSLLDLKQLRKKAQNAINWIQMQNKAHYYHKHSLLFLKVNEWILLRLHRDYIISDSKNCCDKKQAISS